MSEQMTNQLSAYALTAEENAQRLGVETAKRLSAAEAQQRLQQYGPNELTEKKKEPGRQAFLCQYQDFMQIICLFPLSRRRYQSGDMANCILFSTRTTTVQSVCTRFSP